jgi:hypothetical protein
VQHNFGDPSRDLTYALDEALAAEAGSQVTVVDDPGPGPRLQDRLDPDAALEVTVHAGFDFWVADVADPSGEVAASLESANAAASPSARLETVEAAYWTRMGQREYLRWVMPQDEEHLLDGLARLHAAGHDTLVDGSRLIGSFRALGLLVPVWELPAGTGADVLGEPAHALGERLGEALASDAALSGDERAARSGLASRQLTVH